MIEECVAAGWNSVLFDASKLTYEDNMAQTKEVVALAPRPASPWKASSRP